MVERKPPEGQVTQVMLTKWMEEWASLYRKNKRRRSKLELLLPLIFVTLFCMKIEVPRISSGVRDLMFHKGTGLHKLTSMNLLNKNIVTPGQVRSKTVLSVRDTSTDFIFSVLVCFREKFPHCQN